MMNELERKSLRAGLNQLPSEGLKRLINFLDKRGEDLILDGRCADLSYDGKFEGY